MPVGRGLVWKLFLACVERQWQTRHRLATAIFEWIEGFYHPVRRHTSIGSLAPAQFEARSAPAADAA